MFVIRFENPNIKIWRIYILHACRCCTFCKILHGSGVCVTKQNELKPALHSNVGAGHRCRGRRRGASRFVREQRAASTFRCHVPHLRHVPQQGRVPSHDAVGWPRNTYEQNQSCSGTSARKATDRPSTVKQKNNIKASSARWLSVVAWMFCAIALTKPMFDSSANTQCEAGLRFVMPMIVTRC